MIDIVKRSVVLFCLAFFSIGAFDNAPRKLDRLFELILLLQAGNADDAKKLIGEHPEERPLLVNGSGRLSPMLGGSKTSYDNFMEFPKSICRLEKISPQSDAPDDKNAYDVFFFCNGEGKAMQVKVLEKNIKIIDFANVVLPPSPPSIQR